MNTARVGAVVEGLARQFAGSRIVLVNETIPVAAAGSKDLSALVVLIAPRDIVDQVLLQPDPAVRAVMITEAYRPIITHSDDSAKRIVGWLGVLAVAVRSAGQLTVVGCIGIGIFLYFRIISMNSNIDVNCPIKLTLTVKVPSQKRMIRNTVTNISVNFIRIENGVSR